jgi:hypothetical protein
MTSEDEREVHDTHEPEPDGDRLDRGGIACRRCMWFVAFDSPGGRVTDAGARPCVPCRAGPPLKPPRAAPEGFTRPPTPPHNP